MAISQNDGFKTSAFAGLPSIADVFQWDKWLVVVINAEIDFGEPDTAEFLNIALCAF